MHWAVRSSVAAMAAIVIVGGSSPALRAEPDAPLRGVNGADREPAQRDYRYREKPRHWDDGYSVRRSAPERVRFNGYSCPRGYSYGGRGWCYRDW